MHSVQKMRRTKLIRKAPAKDVIEYRYQNFDNPIPNIDDDYARPPTPERNAKWRALRYVGDTRLSKSEASRIHNKTAATQPGSDRDSPIVLTVFHDLHCLVRILFVILAS
jgi:hypothetical protein